MTPPPPDAARFTAALLDPAAPAPTGLLSANGQPAGPRFDIYRNTVTTGLLRALETGFPALRRLLGAECFAATALQFLRAHPPRSPILMLYGDGFADFLAGLPDLAHLAYLPDVARLEQALRESYHAADAPPLPAAALAGLNETALQKARLHLAPALRLVASGEPVFSIWQATLHGGPAPAWQPEAAVVLRPGFDPQPHLLPVGAAAVLHALLNGAPIGTALVGADPGLDLTALLTLLLQGHAIVGLTP